MQTIQCRSISRRIKKSQMKWKSNLWVYWWLSLVSHTLEISIKNVKHLECCVFMSILRCLYMCYHDRCCCCCVGMASHKEFKWEINNGRICVSVCVCLCFLAREHTLTTAELIHRARFNCGEKQLKCVYLLCWYVLFAHFAGKCEKKQNKIIVSYDAVANFVYAQMWTSLK